MDVTNYNVTLAKNRKNYQDNLDEAKSKYKNELKDQNIKSQSNYERLKQEKIRQNRDLQQDYIVKLTDDQKRTNKEIDKQTNILTKQMQEREFQHGKERQIDKGNQKRELDKIRSTYERDQQKVPRAKLDQANRNTKTSDKYYSEKIEEINNRNAAQIDLLQKDLIQEKEQLVKETGNALEQQADVLKSDYNEKTDDIIQNYESRIRNKDREIQNLQLRINTMSKKINERYSRELEQRLKMKDDHLNQERIEMKKTLEEREVNSQIKLSNQRRNFEAQLHEISTRNQKQVDDILNRHNQEIEILNKDHKSEYDTKVRELETLARNQKLSHQLELDSTKEYYDHRLREMQEKLDAQDGDSIGVRVVSK